MAGKVYHEVQEIDVYRSAQFLIKKYGERAPQEAQKRRNIFQEKDNEEAAGLWLKVAAAIAWLQCSEIPEDKQCH